MKNISDFLVFEKSKGDISNYSLDEQQLAAILKPFIGETMDVNISLSSKQIKNGFINQAIDRSIGHIIESYIGSELGARSTYKQGKEIYDCELKVGSTKFNLEIKAFKNGKTSNITFTKNQIENLNQENVTFIFINYDLSQESLSTTVTITDILFGRYNDIVSSNGTLSRHGSVSKMVSLK